MRVATWNLENLFLPGGDFGPRTQDEFDAKLDSLAATIERMAPDVLAVQEVGEPEALDELVERLPGTWHHATGDPDPRGIRNGIVARTPLEDIWQASAFPTGLQPIQVEDTGERVDAMRRPALHAVIDGLHVMSVHLKSKLLSLPNGRWQPRDEDERTRYSVYALHLRAAEAAAVRTAATRVLTEHPEQPLVVMGDFNDEVHAQTTQILQGPPGSEIGTGGFDAPDKGDAQRLWNLAALIPENQRFSRVYRGRGELIDHIFVSHELVYDVVAGGVTTEWAAAATPSITEVPTLRQGESGSDHRPVLAVIARAGETGAR